MFQNDRNEVTCIHCSFVCCQLAIENILNTLTRHCCWIRIFRVFFLLAILGTELELLAILDASSCIIFRCSLSRVLIPFLERIFSAITFSSKTTYRSSILLIEEVRSIWNTGQRDQSHIRIMSRAEKCGHRVLLVMRILRQLNLIKVCHRVILINITRNRVLSIRGSSVVYLVFFHVYY